MFLKSETIIIIGQLIFILILSLIFSTTALSPLNNNGLEGFSTSKLNYTDVSAPTVAKDDLFEYNKTQSPKIFKYSLKKSGFSLLKG